MFVGVRVYKDKSGESVNNELIRVEIHGYNPNLVNKWSEALVAEYVEYRKEKRDAIAFGDISKWEQDRESTAHEIIQLKQKQIELEDQLGFDRLQSEMRTLHNLQTKITKNDQRLQVQEKILSDLRQNDLDVVQKFSLLSSYEDTVLKTGQTISSPLRVGPDGELLDSKGEVTEVVVTPEQSSWMTELGSNSTKKSRNCDANTKSSVWFSCQDILP